MKAEIDRDGVMTVSAETPLEAFALRQWCELYVDSEVPATQSVNGRKLVLKWGLEVDSNG